jgi:FtsH-binding integral membrane protein
VEWIKTITGRIVTGGIALAAVAGGISWWQMDPATREAVVDNTARGAAWFVLVLMIPWLMFWLVSRVAQFDSNAAGAALVAGLTLLEAVALGALFGFTDHSPAGWGLFAAAVCVAGVYNVFTCDWIAEKMG